MLPRGDNAFFSYQQPWKVRPSVAKMGNARTRIPPRVLPSPEYHLEIPKGFGT